MSAKNFTFVKTLARTEIQRLVESRFVEWDSLCLYFINSVRSFHEKLPRNMVKEETQFFFFSEDKNELSTAKDA